jgi:hypothetical protein
MMRAVAIIIAVLFLATGTAHAMQADISNTWCGRQGAKFTGDRQHYYEFVEKCHKRHSTKPCWGLWGNDTCEMETEQRGNGWRLK